MDVLPRDVDQAIQKWDKLGYDLHDRSLLEEDATLVTQELPQSPYAGIKEQHVILTFVKR